MPEEPVSDGMSCTDNGDGTVTVAWEIAFGAPRKMVFVVGYFPDHNVVLANEGSPGSDYHAYVDGAEVPILYCDGSVEQEWYALSTQATDTHAALDLTIAHGRAVVNDERALWMQFPDSNDKHCRLVFSADGATVEVIGYR